jgi:hypothetical protein
VVEHSIGNGEVDSSILSGSTSFLNEIKKQERRLVDSEPAIGICTQNKARSGVPNPCSLFVPRQAELQPEQSRASPANFAER